MVLPSIRRLKTYYKEGDLRGVAKWLPHLRDKKDPFIKFLMESNLLKMKDHINDKALTLGADPEFILCEKKDENKIVLFSSRFVTDYFGLSEAEMGADYGLMEFRPPPTESVTSLVDSIENLHKEFDETYLDFKILEKEAIEYNHKRARVKESMETEAEINYGLNRGKDVGVWAGGGQEMVIGMETGTSLSAYDKPSFNLFNDELFTAGGHIHFGGSYIMMLSFEQLKCFVRKLDEKILPMCKSVETDAGKLRLSVYGSPGEFRIKDYGIEYRSPSNAVFWQKNMDLLLEVLDKSADIAKTIALTQGG